MWSIAVALDGYKIAPIPMFTGFLAAIYAIVTIAEICSDYRRRGEGSDADPRR
jgi:hypothetical protein